MAEQKHHALSWDAEQYSHTLIASPSEARPSGRQVQNFLSAMIEQKVVPGRPSMTLRVPTGQTREYPIINPLTGQNLRVEIKDQKRINSVGEVASALEALRDYELEVVGIGKPRIAPLCIDFTKPYHVGVTCIVRSQPRSTSNLHEAPGAKLKAIPYGQVCTEIPDRGYFSNPYTLEIIEVPGAGCASFWIQFELGKFIFPEFVDGTLALLNPVIVEKAESAFQMGFVQGCYWG